MDYKINKKIFCNKKIQENVVKELYNLQKNGKLCDYHYSLKTEDGGNFRVHKWILYTISSFFKELFDSPLFDSNSDSIVVKDVSESVLGKIIEYMYTGEIEISSDIAKEIMNVAMFLNLPTLIQYCCEILIETINNDNFLELLKYSETCVHYGRELTRKCLEIITKNFNEFVDMPYFCELSSVTMKILVEQDRKTYNEEDLFKAVRKWIIFDLENREKFINDLINKIQLDDCSYDFIKSNILSNNPLLQSHEFNRKLIEYLGNNWKPILINPFPVDVDYDFEYGGNYNYYDDDSSSD